MYLLLLLLLLLILATALGLNGLRVRPHSVAQQHRGVVSKAPQDSPSSLRACLLLLQTPPKEAFLTSGEAG